MPCQVAQVFQMRNFKLCYQQLHLKYLCNLARYWLQAPWGWHDSGKTYGSVIICRIIVHLLVMVQNKKKWYSSIFRKSVAIIQVSLMSDKNVKAYVHFLSYLAHLFWEWEIFPDKGWTKNVNTRFMLSKLFPKIVPFWDNMGKVRQGHTV
jgi:hypothetical protein